MKHSMRHWISCVARAYEREPGLFLLAASVVLAVVFWHLPVPAFLFADPASGSGAACSCSADNCKDWSLIDTDEEDPQRRERATCDRPPWEACDPDPSAAEQKNKLTCDPPGEEEDPEHPGQKRPKTKRIAPKSLFYYEKETTDARCNNQSTHGNVPGQANYDDHVFWIREDVEVNASGQSGDKVIKFDPKLKISFSGFDDANVCAESTGQIVIQSWLYACMSVCGQSELKDSSKGETGWAMVTHDFKKVGTTWKFDGEPNPKEVQFNISAECACANEDDDPDEKVGFKTRIHTNSGVKLGAGNDAFVAYSLSADDTSCSGK